MDSTRLDQKLQRSGNVVDHFSKQFVVSTPPWTRRFLFVVCNKNGWLTWILYWWMNRVSLIWVKKRIGYRCIFLILWLLDKQENGPFVFPWNEGGKTRLLSFLRLWRRQVCEGIYLCTIPFAFQVLAIIRCPQYLLLYFPCNPFFIPPTGWLAQRHQ